jgi:hypothetical protein
MGLVSLLQGNTVYTRQGTGKEELDRLIDMLDEQEIEIAIDYLSNLLLSRAPKIRNHAQPRS